MLASVHLAGDAGVEGVVLVAAEGWTLASFFLPQNRGKPAVTWTIANTAGMNGNEHIKSCWNEWSGADGHPGVVSIERSIFKLATGERPHST